MAISLLVDHTVTLLEKHPEVTDTILDYWGEVGAVDHIDERLVRFLDSDEAVYAYQLYQILDWRGSFDEVPTQEFLAIARRLAFDRTRPSFVRAVARRVLARFGSAADLEQLQREYADASPREQAELLCCLERMELGRRNAFLARCEGDGPWQRRAVAWVRTRPAW